MRDCSLVLPDCTSPVLQLLAKAEAMHAPILQFPRGPITTPPAPSASEMKDGGTNTALETVDARHAAWLAYRDWLRARFGLCSTALDFDDPSFARFQRW